MESGRAGRDSSENYERSRRADFCSCELEKTDDLSDSPWRFLLTCSRPNTDPIFVRSGNGADFRYNPTQGKRKMIKIA